MLNKNPTLLHVDILDGGAQKKLVEYFSCWTRLCVNNNALYLTFVYFLFSLLL